MYIKCSLGLFLVGAPLMHYMVKQLQEKFLRKKEQLCFVFVDLEKAFERMP